MGLEIIQINKDKSYDEWIQFRTRGLGASEIGTLMGVNYRNVDATGTTNDVKQVGVGVTHRF